MGRRNATSWLIAMLLIALGGLGMVRDLHAAQHVVDARAEAHASCEHDTSPASLPLDGQPSDDDCPTCDLLAVLNKSIAMTTVEPTVDHAVIVRMIDAPAAADPVVADDRNDNRTRGPPAVIPCAV